MIPNKGGRKYTMKGEKDKCLCLYVITIIAPVTGWIERCCVSQAKADIVTNQVEVVCLSSPPPLSNKIIIHRGKELLEECKSSSIND